MKRAAIYARVSTDEQAEKGYSLQTQVEACREYAASHSLQVITEIKDDCSGASLDRPGLDELREMLDRGEINTVIVYTDDRLSRSLINFLVLREEWQTIGVELHYVTRGKSENTDEGQFMEEIHASIAKLERAKISERTRRGKIAKAKSGKPVMLGNPPYGYSREGKGNEARMVRNEDQLSVIKKIFQWYTQGNGSGPLSQREIARRLIKKGTPSPTPGKRWNNITIHRITSNEIYAGVTYYGKRKTVKKKSVAQPKEKWIRIDVPELACIDRGTFEEAQRRKIRNKELAKRNKKRNYLLSGHFRCGTCNQVMVGHHRQGYTRYQCTTYWIKPNKDSCPKANRSTATSKVDKAVWDWIVWLISDDNNLEAGLQAMADNRELEIERTRRDLEIVDKLMEKNKRTIERLVAEMANQDDIVLDVFREKIQEATNKKKALEAERIKLSEKIRQVEISEELKDRIKINAAKIRERLPNATYKDKRYLLDVLNVRVTFNVGEDTRWLAVECELPASDRSIVIHDSRSVYHGRCASANQRHLSAGQR